MAIFENELSFRADLSFQVIFNRWSLKNKDKVGVGDSRGWVDGLKE